MVSYTNEHNTAIQIYYQQNVERFFVEIALKITWLLQPHKTINKGKTTYETWVFSNLHTVWNIWNWSVQYWWVCLNTIVCFAIIGGIKSIAICIYFWTNWNEEKFLLFGIYW